MMRTRIFTLIITSILFLSGAHAIAASPPTEVSGAFVVTNLTPTGFRAAGQVCIFTATATFDLDGSVDGVFTADFRFVQKGACPPGPAAKTFKASGAFSGAVLGHSGGADITFQGTTDAQGNALGRLVFRHGADDLSGLHGWLILEGIEGCCGAYAGEVHFAPEQS